MKSGSVVRLSAWACAVLLTGCAGWQPVRGCDAGSILSAADRVWSATAKESDAAYLAAKAAFQQSGSACDRLRLAVLLSHPDAKTRRDDAQALRLAQGYLEPPGSRPADLTGLARYLEATIEARQELEARNRNTNKKLSDERSRAEELGRKLDELRALEKLLDERQRK